MKSVSINTHWSTKQALTVVQITAHWLTLKQKSYVICDPLMGFDLVEISVQEFRPKIFQLSDAEIERCFAERIRRFLNTFYGAYPFLVRVFCQKNSHDHGGILRVLILCNI